MKSNLTVSTTNRHSRNQGDTNETGAIPTPAAVDTYLSAPAHAGPHLTLAPARVWKHTLILRGKLDYRSAHELEDEIECLCEEGVTSLTLDLRRLDAIDPSGAELIAFRSALCKGRGHDFVVIPGSGVIHRALAEAGATDLLMPEPTESGAGCISGRPSQEPLGDVWTTMTKEL